MQRILKAVATFVLLIVCLIVFFVGRSIYDNYFLNKKVDKMIQLTMAQDMDGSYALRYPGQMELESHSAAQEAIYEYVLPATEDYTLELQAINTSLTEHKSQYKGRYKVEIHDKVFYLNVVWIEKNDKSGFTVFEVSNEDEWEEDTETSVSEG